MPSWLPSFLNSRMKRQKACIWLSVVIVLVFVVVKSGIIFTPPPQDTVYKTKNGTRTDHASSPTTAPTLSPSAAPSISASHAPTWGPSPSTTSVSSSSPPVPLLTAEITFRAGRGDNYNLSQTELDFVEKYCDLQPNAEWYPSTVDRSWQQRTPYVILPGAMQSATTSLYQALLQHPNITNAAKRYKDLDSFSSLNFMNFLKPARTSSAHVVNATATTLSGRPPQKRKVFAARERIYARDYTTTNLKKNESLVAVDLSASYLHQFFQVPFNILCVAPWAKLVILLRDPVDRLYSQWAHRRSFFNLQQTFEDWIAQELHVMQESGLIANAGSEGGKMSIDDEFEAYRRYKLALRRISNEAAIGRSLYVLQLEGWVRAYREAGKSVSHDILVVPSEALVAHPESVYPNILRFLGLPPAPCPSPFPHANRPRFSSEAVGMKPETRAMLQAFFAPYNKRLFRFLKENKLTGVVQDWRDIWGSK